MNMYPKLEYVFFRANDEFPGWITPQVDVVAPVAGSSDLMLSANHLPEAKAANKINQKEKKH